MHLYAAGLLVPLLWLLQGAVATVESLATIQDAFFLNNTSSGILDVFCQRLPASTQEAILQNTTTGTTAPQAKAYSWLLENANNVDMHNQQHQRLQQLFGLTCFYFGLQGNQSFYGDALADWLWLEPVEMISTAASRTVTNYNLTDTTTQPAECQWNSITCDASSSNNTSTTLTAAAVSSIRMTSSLSQSKLSSGRLVPELAFVETLEILQMRNGWVTEDLIGAIPTEWGTTMKSLQALNLTRNRLSGGIPSEFGQLSTLTSLHLFDTWLRGTLPSQLGTLLQLEYLELGINKLTGTIPSQLGLLHGNLEFLSLRHNWELRGSLPTELGLLTSLTELEVAGNRLTGDFLRRGEFLQMEGLETVSIHHNKFGGVLPAVFPPKLTSLYMSYTETVGSLPNDLSGWVNMTIMELYKNELGGTLPTAIGILTALEQFSIGSNNLRGTVPTQIGLMTALSTLSLWSNSFDGRLPSELGLLVQLTGLFLFDNDFTGAIPSQLGLLRNLTRLTLVGANDLDRYTIPSELGWMGDIDTDLPF